MAIDSNSDVVNLQESNSTYIESHELFVEDINPGEELRSFLKKLFPLDPNSDISFLARLDGAMKADGEFINITYESIINYLLRRIINTSEFLKRECESDENDPNPGERFLEKLRLFLQEELSIQESSTEKILAIVLLCLNVKSQNRKMTRIKRKKIIQSKIQEHGELFCYICGKSLTNEEAEIEHMWPKAMGGTEKDHNLKVSCKHCNKYKQDYIDASDFHYEEICIAQEEGENSFSGNFKRLYKIALWAKNNYSCILCGTTAESVGRLKFVRKNSRDSWHFLNIDAYCESCLNPRE